ncbi:MAG: RHS repeat-associated core domain-containing protein, partial [Chloroflexota bacterium]
GATYYFLLDGQGSVLDLVDSSGTVYDKYTYDPYGNITSGNTTSARETVANPFRYLGAVLDASTGLYHLGARYYDPALGRFTQPDPSNTGAPGDYTYGGDAPSSLSDPSGLMAGVAPGGSEKPCPSGWQCMSSQELLDNVKGGRLAGFVFALLAFLITAASVFFGFAAPAILVLGDSGAGMASSLVSDYFRRMYEKCKPRGARFRTSVFRGLQAECW